VFWSPRKLREAKARDAAKEREEEEEKLRKADTKKLKAATTSCLRVARKCERGAQEGRGSEGCGTCRREISVAA
jgi:hypothetical protein